MTDDSKAAAFAQYLEKEDGVVVPSLVIYEVYKQLAKNRGRALADRFMSQALHNRIVPMDETIALAAANASLDHRLNGPDAIVYATARVCHSLPTALAAAAGASKMAPTTTTGTP